MARRSDWVDFCVKLYFGARQEARGDMAVKNYAEKRLTEAYGVSRLYPHYASLGVFTDGCVEERACTQRRSAHNVGGRIRRSL